MIVSYANSTGAYFNKADKSTPSNDVTANNVGQVTVTNPLGQFQGGDVDASILDEKNVNVEEVKEAQSKSFNFWLVVFVLYVLYAIFKSKKLSGAKDAVSIKEVLPNVHNFILIGISAVLFKTLANMIFTKLVKFNIPIVSKLSAGLLPIINS